MTDAELAILSIVAEEGPIAGYAIQTVVERRGLRAWTHIGISSMYYVLEKLERQELIASRESDRTEGPSRRHYQITPAGIGVLQTAVADLLSTPHESVNGFELGLANLNVLRASQVRSALLNYRLALTSRINQARSREQEVRDSHAPFHVGAIFSHQIALLEAELAWIEWFIARWEEVAVPDDSLAELPGFTEIPRMKQVILPHDPDSPHRAQTRPLKEGTLPIEPRDSSASSMADTALNNPTPPAAPPPESPSEPDHPPVPPAR